MKKNTKGFGIYILVLAIIAIFIVLTSKNAPTSNTDAYYYSNLIQDINSGKIVKIDVTSNAEVTGTGKARVFFDANDPKNYKEVTIPNLQSFMTETNSAINQNHISVVDTKALTSTSWITNIAIPVGFAILSIFFILYIMQQAQGRSGGGGRDMNFGKSKARLITSDKNKINFDNVAGLEEEKIEMSEIVEFLKLPQKFIEIGARIPKGVLLVGPPGTGKTLLAKAVAGESKVPFFSISGSDFVEMYVGVGASRVRDMFLQAKKHAPCLIFIDEIDAVGRRRGSGHGGGHDEREQTLNQLLVEMDGFSSNEGIIIIAATNRRDILDPALLRPGRFDREVVVNRPDVKGREEILKVHAKGKMIGNDVDLKTIAKSTSGFTGADLENLLNESALISAREDLKEISMESVRKAVIKVGIGTEKRSKVVSDKDRRITAYHESGHAILQEVLKELDPVHIVSIIPTGTAGGYTMHIPEDDQSYTTKTKMEQEIIATLGGRAAEEIIFNEITTGASSDINRVTSIARSMITKFGMNENLGLLELAINDHEGYLGGSSRSYSEETASIIDKEMKKLIDKSYEKAKSLLNENMDILHKSSNLLLEKDKINGKEFRALFPVGILPEKEISNSLMNPEGA